MMQSHYNFIFFPCLI